MTPQELFDQIGQMSEADQREFWRLVFTSPLSLAALSVPICSMPSDSEAIVRDWNEAVEAPFKAPFRPEEWPGEAQR